MSFASILEMVRLDFIDSWISIYSGSKDPSIGMRFAHPVQETKKIHQEDKQEILIRKIRVLSLDRSIKEYPVDCISR